MNQKYYVSLYFDKSKFTPASDVQLESLAEEYRACGRGDPRMGMPSLRESRDAGDYAYLFYEVEHASEFAKRMVDLEFILSVRMGLFR